MFHLLPLHPILFACGYACVCRRFCVQMQHANKDRGDGWGKICEEITILAGEWLNQATEYPGSTRSTSVHGKNGYKKRERTWRRTLEWIWGGKERTRSKIKWKRVKVKVYFLPWHGSYTLNCWLNFISTLVYCSCLHIHVDISSIQASGLFTQRLTFLLSFAGSVSSSSLLKSLVLSIHVVRLL